MACLDEIDLRNLRGLPGLALLAMTVWSMGLGAVCRAQTTPGQEPLVVLEVGKPRKRSMSGGETQVFQIKLRSGQSLRVIADQQGIDIAILISTFDGRRLVEMDSLNGTQGAEVAMVAAADSERYRVEIRSPGKDAPSGSFTLKVELVETAGQRERQWIEAQQAYAEGRRLRAQPGMEAQTQALGQFEEALRRWRLLGDHLMTVHTLYYIAAVHRRLGRLQQALSWSEQARQAATETGDDREIATAETSIAHLHSLLGEPRKSIDLYRRALEQWRSLGDPYGEARTLLNLGVAYAMLGEARTALDHYNQTLPYWRKLENRRQLADTLKNIGGAYELLADWQKALESYNGALTLYHALGNAGGEAGTLNNLGFIYEQLNELQKALEYYEGALRQWRAMEDRNEEAWTLTNIGFVYARMNRPQKSLEYCRQSLEVQQAQEDRRGRGTTFLLMGDMLASSDRQQALEYYDQALPLLRAAEDRWREAAALRSLGMFYLTLGDWPQARRYLDQSLTLYRELGARSGEAQTLYSLACLERDRGDFAAARRQIELGIGLVERLRADLASYQLRASYAASAQKFYELEIDALMKLHRARPAEGFDAVAVQASERARARSLLELLAESRVNLRQGVDPALLERERDLTELLSAKAARQLQLGANSAQSAALKQEISRLENEFEQTQAAIRKTSPHYAALVQPQPLTLAEIQEQLDENTLLLEYKLGEERSWLWAISHRTLVSYELPKRESIELAAGRFRRLLTARSVIGRGETAHGRSRRLIQADAQASMAAKQLSSMILGPAAARFLDHRLIFVPDGALHSIPFAALPDPGRGRHGGAQPPSPDAPLMIDHEIVTLPSASTLAAHRRNLAGRAIAPRLLAVLADPVFRADDARIGVKGKRTVFSGQAPSAADRFAGRGLEHPQEDSGGFNRKIPRLPFTLQEADGIAALASMSSTLKATGFDASRALALSPELGLYRYLHFATHGLLDRERPGLSGLALSLVDADGRPQDGFLRVNDIYNLKLPVELVVLSACQTGLGKSVKGEGLVGLTQAFMYSGANRVMVSLWNVNDRATAELMTRFYRKVLKENQRPAAALRAAQAEMWKRRSRRAPYYWAAFILQGEWR